MPGKDDVDDEEEEEYDDYDDDEEDDGVFLRASRPRKALGCHLFLSGRAVGKDVGSNRKENGST